MGAQIAKVTYANDVTYEGQVKNNLPHGRGSVTSKNNQIFQGLFQNGEATFGKIKCQGILYEGTISKKDATGDGSLLYEKQNIKMEGKFNHAKIIKGKIQGISAKNMNQMQYSYEGFFIKNGILNGKGIYQNLVGRTVEGQFKNGNLTGHGKYIHENGDIYEGEFLNGKKHGKGRYIGKQMHLETTFQNDSLKQEATIQFTNGDRYSGQIKDGKMHGEGEYISADGTIYKGTFYFNCQWGSCKISYPKDHQIQLYEGEVNEGLYNGIGTIFYANAVIYKGYFLQGAKNGPGVIIYCKDRYKCLYLMDQLIGTLRKYQDSVTN